MFRRLPLQFFFLIAVAMPNLFCLFAEAQTYGEPGDLRMPPIAAQGYVASVIAIPEFEHHEGSEGGKISPALFPDVIYNDLRLFSDIAPARNQTFVERAHASDLREDRVNYAEWKLAEANYVLKGVYSVENNRILADVHLYDVDYNMVILARRYRNFDAEKPRRLAHQISDDILQTVFRAKPVANTQILFISQRDSPRNKEVYVMDADGNNQRRLTSDNTITATPTWGKNMTEIYYTSYKDYNPDLYLLQPGTGKSWPISRRPLLNFAPAWSTARERIALTLGRDGNSEIYTMDRTGKEKTLERLTHVAGIDTSPDWNPAGNQIVFTSDRTGTPQIYVMNADGTNARRLTRQGTYNDSATWSPLGDRIAFVSRDRGVFNVITMNLEGSDWRQLTANQSNNEDPSWAPDGRHLCFSSDRTGQYQIYVMRSDGTNQYCLTTAGSNQSPAWSPGATQE